jgi:hypothetical protein
VVEYFVKKVIAEIDKEIETNRSGLESCSVEGIKTLRAKIGGLRWAKQVINEVHESMKETDITREEIFSE